MRVAGAEQERLELLELLAPPAGVGGRGPTGPCPSGASRGTPPSRDPESKYDMGGPQYDFDNNDMYPGQFYEQSTGRGIIAFPGTSRRSRSGQAEASYLLLWLTRTL